MELVTREEVLEGVLENTRGDYPQPVSGEDANAYATFIEWLRLGTGRKVTVLYRRLGNPEFPEDEPPSLSTLYKWKREFLWEERAREWDKDNAQARIEHITREAEKNKLERVTALGILGSKLLDRVADIDFDSMPDERVIGALKILFSEMRDEFNDLPTHKATSVKRIEVSEAQMQEIGAKGIQQMCSGLIEDEVE